LLAVIVPNEDGSTKRVQFEDAEGVGWYVTVGQLKRVR
jgi:hypothetical protein